MPMCDAYIPKGALPEAAERELLDEERRAAVTRATTEALAEEEGGAWPNPQLRVWVFTFEVPDGMWGGLGGRVITLPDMVEHVAGERGRRYSQERLAERRREQARVLLEAADAEKAAVDVKLP